MPTAMLSRTPAPALLAVLSSLCVASCGGDRSSGAFRVERVDLGDAAAVERNRPIAVTFSSPVDPESVTPASFHVRRGAEVVPGRIEIEGRRVTYFPTLLPGDRDDYRAAPPAPRNGVGFPSGGRYQLVVLGSGPLAMRSTGRREISETTTIRFQTGASFVAESPAVAPRLVAPPSFDPEPLDSGFEPDPRHPSLAPLVHPSRVKVTVTFTEPMDPGRFDPFDTFSVTNATEGDPAFGSTVLGRVVASGDARSFTFVAATSLGDREGTPEPSLFRVRLDGALEGDPLTERRLADLAGNPLAGNPDVDGHAGPIGGPVDFFFRTADSPGEPEYGTLTETFEDDALRSGSRLDPTTAIWPSGGWLEGAPATRTAVTVDPPDTGFLLPQPLTSGGNRIQLRYTKSPDLAAVRALSLVGWEWGPRSAFVFASTYRGMTVTVGPAQRELEPGSSPVFSDNFDRAFGAPRRVFAGDYSVPTLFGAIFFPWPEFETDFEYDGESGLVFDVDVPPGAESFQLFRQHASGPNPWRRLFGPSGSATAEAGDDTVYHTRFSFVRKRTVGVSRLVDTGVPDPDYVPPVMLVDASRAGTSAALFFRGEDDDGHGGPDGRTTGVVEDLDALDGMRFFQFRVALDADPFTGVVPRVASVSLAWRKD